MSSAILYLAIVAIWICVLVPRWLRHDTARDGHLRLRRFSRRRGRGPDAGTADQFEHDELGQPDDPRPPAPARTANLGTSSRADVRGFDDADDDAAEMGRSGAYVSAPVMGDTEHMAPTYETAGPPVRTYGWSAEEFLRQERASQRPGTGQRPGGAPRPGGGPPPAKPRDGADVPGPGGRESRYDDRDDGRRARMLTARRRMLWTLLGLTGAAVGLTAIGMTAWWVIVPPSILLAGYTLLLREAARADAELRQRRAGARAAALARRTREAEARRTAESRRAEDARRAAAAARAADVAADAQQADEATGRTADGSTPSWGPHQGLPHADVIDISERVNDELYDQYADAKLRAVGD